MTIDANVSPDHATFSHKPRDSVHSQANEPIETQLQSQHTRKKNVTKLATQSSITGSILPSSVRSQILTNGLRETFLDAIGRRFSVNDPLELAATQEFHLHLVDQSGGMNETIGQILKLHMNCSEWSIEDYIVLGLGIGLVVAMAVLTETCPSSLNGYTIDPGLVFGSLVTLILCACVFVTYHGVQSFQRHPNPLIYYKCVVDIIVALRFLLDPLLLKMKVYSENDEASCAYLSGITQFLYLSSDCWYFVQIIDWYWSLTNPFMSVKANRKRFKIFVYSAGALTGSFAAFVPGIHGFADGNYCWTKRRTVDDPVKRAFFHLNVNSWLLFYTWMILFYISGITVLTFGVKRLRSGLRDTLQSRREMLRNGALSITSYTIYWTIVFIWYALSFHTRTIYDKDGNFPPSRVFRAFTFTLSARGAVDYFVWFMVNRPSLMRQNWLKFTSDSADKQFSAQLNTTLQEELIYFIIEGMTRAVQIAEDNLLRSFDQSSTQELALGAGDDENNRKSKQNLAEAATTATGLTGSVSSSNLLHNGQRNRIMYSIQEVINARLHRNSTSDVDKQGAKRRNTEERDFSFDIPADQHLMQQPPNVGRHTNNPSSASAATISVDPHSSFPVAGAMGASIRFTPYEPQAFAELRQAYGIKAADFMKSFQTSTKPNISEGASGAFMFFSGDKKYIVKSMAEEEARFLCKIAEKYVEYLTRNPSSLITKFYGCFKITMYDKRFYFIVMENLFDVMEQGVQIHHRFDIKGSWVSRSYKRPRRGAKVKCRHCSMMFKYGAKKGLLQCPNVVGLHEPNVVLKDNDLRTRMRIGTEEGIELFEQLRNDSLFLCNLGIMDYSLLLGVMDVEFTVDQQPFQSQTSSVLDEHTIGTTGSTTAGTSTLTMSLTNDSFVSATSSNWSSFIESSARDSSRSTQSPDHPDDEVSRMRHTPRNKFRLNLAPSVHSVFQHCPAPLNPSRSPCSSGEPQAKRSMRKSQRVFGPGYYYVGIIDILQTWTLQKQLERVWKVHIQQKDRDGLSALDPVHYQRRFEAKLREIIAIPKDLAPHRNELTSGTMAQSIQRLHPILQATAAFENAAAMQEARRTGARNNDMTGLNPYESSSSSMLDESDLEQAGRNPEPILVPFNQRVITTNAVCSHVSSTDKVACKR